MSTNITVTEALAELSLIDKKVGTMSTFVLSYLTRDADRVDPLEKDGGSVVAIKEKTQAINDLFTRKIKIRSAISESNSLTDITINGVSRTVEDWLVWKREVAPQMSQLLDHSRSKINSDREKTKLSFEPFTQSGRSRAADRLSERVSKTSDIVVNMSEQELQDKIEALEDTLGKLDGALSLKNATTLINV